MANTGAIIYETLQNFMLGRLYMVGLRAFEGNMDPFVKNTMRAKYPLSPAEVDARDKFTATEAAEDEKMRKLPELLRAAQKLLRRAQQAVKTMDAADAAARKAKIQAVSTAKKEWKHLQDFEPTFNKRRKRRREQFVQPRWVKECQSVVGPSMVPFTTFERQWDMYTHVEVITGHLRDIFAPATGLYEFQAKELLDKLRLACEARLWRAHPELFEKPREAEVLDFLGTMHSVLNLCGCAAGATSVGKVLEEAQALMERAVAPVSGAAAASPAPLYQEVRMPLQAFERHMLYVAMYDFAQRLQRLVGRFRFKEASVSIPGAEEGAAEAGKRPWPPAWRARVKQAKTRFQTIAQARAALFHSDHAKWKDVNVASVLRTMGEVLQWLHPGPLAATAAAPPPAATLTAAAAASAAAATTATATATTRSH